jgi:ABC-type transport system substrate-binding protein
MLKDENLRKAIAYAIDVQSIIDIACEGYGTPCTSLWGPYQYGFYDEFEEPWGYDLEKAKEYMAKSN